MRIGAYDYLTGKHQPLLMQKDVLNAHLSAFEVIYSLFPGKIAQHLGLFRGSYVLVGNKMVRYHNNFFRIEYLFYPELAEFFNRDRGGYIVRQYHIGPNIDEITRAQIFIAAMGSQYGFS
jgi:hypothetical protein